MKNLIEQSFLIDNNCAHIKSDGTRVPMHKYVNVRIPKDGYVYYYSIYRSNGISASHIEMRKTKADYPYVDTVKSYWKFYDDNAKFESAIKRIERKVSLANL